MLRFLSVLAFAAIIAYAGFNAANAGIDSVDTYADKLEQVQ